MSDLDFRLPNSVRPVRYDLGIEVDLDAWLFRGREEIEIAVAEPTNTVIVHAEHVGVREPGGDANLTKEPLGSRGGDLGFQHLDRDVPVVAQVAREVDRRHPAASQLSLETIPIRDLPALRRRHHTIG